jgi:hypothetical protein
MRQRSIVNSSVPHPGLPPFERSRRLIEFISRVQKAKADKKVERSNSGVLKAGEAPRAKWKKKQK